MDEKTNYYLDLIKSYEPELNIYKYETDFSNGWHNDIVFINDSLVFRFGKVDWTIDLLEYEAKVLQVLHEFVTLPVPQFTMIERGVVKYKFIPGNPLYRHDILFADDKTIEAIAKKLGVFLRQMHTIPTGALERIGVNLSQAQSEANSAHNDALSIYSEVKEKLYPNMRKYTQNIIEKCYSAILKDNHSMDYEPVLIHADLAPYHILCDEKLDLTGIIDFGVSRLGDPAADIALILICLGEGLVKRMQNYYPEIESFINRARFIAATLPLLWELRALESGKIKWSLFHLMEAKDIYPIGILGNQCNIMEFT